VFKKMVQVVHHCHELGVMHRDLKVLFCAGRGQEGAGRAVEAGLMGLGLAFQGYADELFLKADRHLGNGQAGV
jgi:serine/threonine protein kinase